MCVDSIVQAHKLTLFLIVQNHRAVRLILHIDKSVCNTNNKIYDYNIKKGVAQFRDYNLPYKADPMQLLKRVTSCGYQEIATGPSSSIV
jgi:hypothetical protein